MSSFFFFKQKTAYEMRISDWSSDVCSSDLRPTRPGTQDPFMIRRIARGSLDRRTIVAERIRVAGRNIIIVRAIVPTEGMVTICHHGTVAALATRAELTLDLAAARPPNRITADRDRRHNFRRLHPIESAT